MPDSVTIQPLFPACVATRCLRITEEECRLYPQERVLVARAVPKRRREFAAGRRCAREALAALGFAAGALVSNADRSIAWPPGVTGAVSHSDAWSGAAVGRTSDVRGIGLDIETVGRVTRDLWRRVLTPPEDAMLRGLAEPQAQVCSTVIFAAKEAVYKCLHPLLDVRMGFMDAQVDFGPGMTSITVSMSAAVAARMPAGAVVTARFLVHENDVFCGIVLAHA